MNEELVLKTNIAQAQSRSCLVIAGETARIAGLCTVQAADHFCNRFSIRMQQLQPKSCRQAYE